MYKSIDDPARRQMEKRIEGISLGVFFFWIGFCWLFQFCMSVPLIGISLIIFSAQIVRILAGFKPQGFWLFLGLIFFLSGLIYLKTTRIELIPIFFMAAGFLLLMRHIKPMLKRKEKK